MSLQAGFKLGTWQVQPDQNRLTGSDCDVRLTPRAMEVLVCLAEHAGKVVSRDDFSKHVWSPAIVSDDALTRSISELRRQLGDRTDAPSYIETIPKRGYRLLLPVTAIADDNSASLATDKHADKDTDKHAVSHAEELTYTPRPLGLNSIAVLPFQTIGDMPAAPLADGIHQDLLTRLAAIADLKVISSTSVRRYRDTLLSLPEIAAQLGVAWILEGAVQQAGDHLQVNAQLIDASRDHHLWARTYRRPWSAKNLFALQGEIMEDIATSLQASLDSAQRLRGEHISTDNLEAYSRYMQGRSLLDTRTREGMQQALAYFRNALERHNDYALAWVGLADSLMLLYDYYDQGQPERLRGEVEMALRRALEIDPKLAAAHASSGLYHMSHAAAGALRADGLDGPAALRWLQQAVKLQPGYAEAYNWLSWVLQLLGDADQALHCAHKSIELNPLSAETIHNVMSSNMVKGHFGRALREARRIEELGMYDNTPQFYEAIAMHHLGRFQDAINLLQGLQVEWAGAGPQAALALAEIASGNVDAANGLLQALEHSGDVFCVGLVQAALGHTDKALAQFEQIRQWGQWPALVMHHFYPDVIGPLRSDARFIAISASLHAYYGLDADGKLHHIQI